jgi:carbonic anhydrase/acetyltransferase-like protein (isoleucine patch superfamily)
MYALGDRAPELIGDGHFVAPTATVIGHVRLLPEASIWFNCVLRGDNEPIEVGAGSNVQDVTVGHKVMLHGCTIGDNSLIGIGSTILNGAKIGRNCLVGAHSLVTEGKSFPDGSLILGSPARVVRELTEEEIAGVSEAAHHYVTNAARFTTSLREA